MGTLAAAGMDNPAERQELLNVLNIMAAGSNQQQPMNDSLKETFAVVTRMKDGLKATVTQIDRAFQHTMLMYQVSFYMGVALIAAAIVFAIVNRESLLPVALGGMGTADVLTFFFTKPPERLQSSRASLAQLQIGLINWFNDLFNQNTYMGQLNQQKSLDLATFERLSDVQMDHTERIMRVLQTYCKLVEGPVDSPAQAAPKARAAA